jgi:hypothetical protein
MSRQSTIVLALLTASSLGSAPAAEESRFEQTYSRSQYVHWIDLYDAQDQRIDPTAEGTPPYSPRFTCGRCHDYAAIAGGHHFNGRREASPAGRPGEPWIWTDQRTGTQIPLSYRGWPGTYAPDSLGISTRDFVLKFGHHLPGGGPGETVPKTSDKTKEAKAGAAGEAEGAEGKQEQSKAKPSKAEVEANRWKLSGLLDIDCMFCHGNDHTYSPEAWWEQVKEENFAWAPTVALGIGRVEGKVSGLPDDFDPATVAADSRNKLPVTTFTLLRVNGEKKVFFDVIRKPSNNVCYYCHSTYPGDEHAAPDWNRDEDVHLRAGFACADCHGNGIDHHTVRGFEGETHPTGEATHTLSCVGCHLNDDEGGGRMGAPKPQHKGLPPLHFEKLSCTACHAGPSIETQAKPVRTSLAHSLGLPTHPGAEVPPGIKQPVMLRDNGKLYPHRMVWPAFWGQKRGEAITPLNPDAVYEATRKTLRVRSSSDFRSTMLDVKLSSADKKEILGEERSKLKEEELTDEEKAKLAGAIEARGRQQWQEKLVAALTELKGIITEEGAEPVFVSAGKVYRLGAEGAVETFEHAAAEPYAWKFGHDVRPARLSLGAKGCRDCHALGAALFESTVAAAGQAPDDSPPTHAMHELAGYDKTKLDAWAASFQGRTAFKFFGYGAMSVVALVFVAFVLQGITGLLRFGRRR